jgi:hypothetical protein
LLILALRAGNYIDKRGTPRTFTRTDLERIRDMYDPAMHEAPFVLNDPREGDPAWGWVQGLHVKGNELVAELIQVASEVGDILQRGLFKKRSIGLYPDLSLKYLGVTGATVPRISGLAAMGFKEGPFTLIEFHEEGLMNEFEIRVERQRRAGEVLQGKIAELLNSQRRYDKFGNPIPANLTYSQALSIVCRENPAEALAYAESLSP